MSDVVALPTTAIEGRYRIERQLGESAMATVYLAGERRHHREIALEVLKRALVAAVGVRP